MLKSAFGDFDCGEDLRPLNSPHTASSTPVPYLLALQYLRRHLDTYTPGKIVTIMTENNMKSIDRSNENHRN